ncbi:hypothetical protein HRM2_26170 [Desulforapulum autotrophicum HRM2]|uniref:Uncharacterized protein n=1 Tax=Desulforapulum autotrophicum (strain ATCC 43914 / DSM 3382 / VKM B-1955 / HRM2) TaxID=177437 RepID=C0QH62_DESAH|nr:hypothetical protein HRM2_26170 [Desulforapulum autotrophicum HRM2]
MLFKITVLFNVNYGKIYAQLTESITPLNYVKNPDPEDQGFYVRLNIRDSETNNSSILLVFQLVFCVASKGTYFNMLPLIRLEYELKSCTIFVELFTSEPLC